MERDRRRPTARAHLSRLEQQAQIAVERGQRGPPPAPPGLRAGLPPGVGVGGDPPVPITSGGGGGAAAVIQKQTLAAPAGTITFSSIPATFSHLQLTATCRSAHNAGGSDVLQLRFNNDAVVNNYMQYVGGSAAVASAGETIGGNIMEVGVVVNDTDADSSHATSAWLYVLDYANTTWYKNVLSEVFMPVGSLSGNLFRRAYAGFWKSPAAVNRIDLTLAGGNNFKTGSVFSLYGIS